MLQLSCCGLVVEMRTERAAELRSVDGSRYKDRKKWVASLALAITI